MPVLQIRANPSPGWRLASARAAFARLADVKQSSPTRLFANRARRALHNALLLIHSSLVAVNCGIVVLVGLTKLVSAIALRDKIQCLAAVGIQRRMNGRFAGHCDWRGR